MKTERQAFARRVKELRTWADDQSKGALSSPERDQLVRASITILLAGSFEYHVKMLIRNYITAVNKLRIPFKELPDPVRHCHLERGAEQLRTTAKKERVAAREKSESPSYIDSHRVLARLASVDAGVPYDLVWEAFAETNSNPGPKTVSGILKKLNLQEPWPTIANNASNPFVRPGRKKATPVSKNELQGLLVSSLNNLVEARNRCAHGAIDAAAPEYSTLHEYLDAVDAISDGIHKALETALAGISTNQSRGLGASSG